MRSALLCALTASCTGVVGTATTDDPGPEGLGLPEGVDFVPPATRMRRLTQSQFVRSVHAIFGSSVEVPLSKDVDNTPDTFSSIEASESTVSRRTAESFEQAALAVARQTVTSASQEDSLGDCYADPTAGCAAAIVQRIGRQLFRRPLEESEVDRYVSVLTAAGAELDVRRLGLEYVITSLLTSPSFLYVYHRGEPTTNERIRQYSGQELAERLALFLWDAIPDEPLLAAAEAGELSTRHGIEEQTRRMLDQELASDLAVRFFAEAWQVRDLEVGSKSMDVFPDWSSELAQLYRTEFELVLRDLILEPASDMRALFTGSETYANQDLASVYGIPATDSSFVRVPLNGERSGLITSGAVMAANANPDRTSPTHRGLFVVGNILCQSIPEPPASVDLTLEDRGEEMTGREIVEMHLAEPACAGCHAAFDPYGLAFENFDAIGFYRTREQGQPVDPVVEIDGQTFAGFRELAEHLAADDRVPRCLSRRVFEFAGGTGTEPDQWDLLDRIGDEVAAGSYRFTELVAALVSSPGFRFFTVRPEEQP